MYKICYLLALTFLAIVGAVETEDGVLVLTDANFDEELAKHEFLLVEFYAPWCGHCKKLAPEYSAAAEVLAKNTPAYALAKVDATEQKAVAERFGVQGFPTLYFFKNGEKMEYTGGRTKDTIVSWILKKAGPPSTKVTCDELKAKVADAKFALAYFGAEDADLYKNAHVAYANAEDKIQFFHGDAECGKTYGAEAGIVFFRKFETTENVYTGAADKDALQAFVKPLMVPTVFEFGEDEIEAIFGQQQNTLFLFRSSEKDKDAKFMATFEEAANANKGKILFAYSDIKDGIQQRLAEFMGLSEEMLPIMRAITPADMKKFQSETKPADLTVEIITKFVDDVIAGKVAPHLKSQEIPEKNDEPVVVVVGKSFDAVVKDESKDVFVKFYAPWCGHCKKLAPIWEELAESYKSEESVVIAKFDSTANEAEGVEVRGFPTLIFYPAGNKAGVTYEGERDLESFKKWIEENKTQAAQKTEL